jgi:alpha-beta hydrolase superfamily lysophospholipase
MDVRRHATRWARRLGVFVTLLAVAGYSSISVFSAALLTRTNNRPPLVELRALGPEAQAWSTRTEDGLTLRGCYLPTVEKRRLVVIVHGMKSSWDRLADIGRDLHTRGFDVLMFDLRGHGSSDPHRLTMGRAERADIRAALAWAKSRGFTPDRIGWLGHSMGASTILMEAGENDEVRAAVLDSPFGDLPELLDKQLSLHSHLPKFFNPGILLAANKVYGVRTDDLVPIESARKWRDRPLLVIHGEDDALVPVAQARRLAERAGPTCEAVFLERVGHTEAYEKLGSRYVDMLATFFERHLSN